jgi:uncharacterized membrane protein HdeD (DUF308 family)
MTPRSRSLHKTGRKAVVWITFARGAMAIALGLALALHHDRAPAALANFMGVYWILNGVVALQWGLMAESQRRVLPLVAGAIGIVTGSRAPVERRNDVPALASRRRGRSHRGRP